MRRSMSKLRRVASDDQTTVPARPSLEDDLLIKPPRGMRALPDYDGGWLVLPDDSPRPFLSFVDADPSANWSDELEALHEAYSRTHFIDRWTRSAIVERVGVLPSEAVLADLGCSTGFLLEELQIAHPHAKLIGIDLVAAGLRKAHRALPEARLLHADARALPVADSCLDAIVSANLLEHVQDDRAALREMARVLRPRGRVVIVVPAGPRTYDYYDRFLGHERRYARGELGMKCVESGLEPLEDTHIAALLYPAFWIIKQRNRRRYSHLCGKALEERVASDINRTHGSRAGGIAWTVEKHLVNAGLRVPFGIRSLVVARRTA